MTNKPKLCMTVGLPGVGKSTCVKRLEGEAVVCSSDEIRLELFPEKQLYTPEENMKVFIELHKRVKENLNKGLDVVYDATNLNKRRRIAFLREIKNIECEKICLLFVADLSICRRNNQNREKQVPDEYLTRTYLNFQPPHKSEGWDKIVICYPEVVTGEHITSVLSETMKGFDQENFHHSLTLKGHLWAASDYIAKRTNDRVLRLAALYHDIGKIDTKVRGEDGQCHYYQHHCAGAYLALNLSEPRIYFTRDEILEFSNLIYYHMHPYLSWKESERTRKRDRQLLGEELFNKVMLLHEADVASH